MYATITKKVAMIGNHKLHYGDVVKVKPASTQHLVWVTFTITGQGADKDGTFDYTLDERDLANIAVFHRHPAYGIMR